MTTLLSENLWPYFRNLTHNSATKRAAIAYVTTDEYIQFGAGEVLVVDASDAAIAAGQTDAAVLERALDRGARLFSYQHLHAKVLVFDGSSSIGSANMSWLSAEVLTEANWLSDDAEMGDLANAFIDSLLETAIPIDRDFVERIKAIEVQPRSATGYTGVRSYRRRRPHPVLLYFQEIMPGDVRKYQTSSADAQTGGGARDLRVSPAATYERVLRRMFTRATGSDGVFEGRITWRTESGDDQDTAVELWSPTDARPNELRIARFYEVGGWQMNEEQYNDERSNGQLWYFILEMGANGLVTARLLQLQHLDLEDPLVAEHVHTQNDAATSGHAVRGAVDLIDRVTYP